MGLTSLWGKSRRFGAGVKAKAHDEGKLAALAFGWGWFSQFSERQGKAVYTHLYDTLVGVDTRPDNPGDERPENPLHQDALYYDRVNPFRFRRVVKKLGVSPDGYSFVDLGCGKGAALLLALSYGFKSVIGVELNDRLSIIAKANTETVIARKKLNARAEIVTEDVVDYDFPSGPIVLFLYNPFGPDTLRAVLKNLEISLRQSPRDVRVAYTSPWHGSVFEESGFFEQIPGSAYRWGAAYRAVPGRS